MDIKEINQFIESILDIEKELTCYTNYDAGLYDTITYEKGNIILHKDTEDYILGECEKCDFYTETLNKLSSMDILKQYELIEDADGIIVYQDQVRYY